MDFKINQDKLEKIEKSIYKLVDDYVDLKNINMISPYSYDDNYNEYEDPYIEIYYLGDWHGEEDSEILFIYFHPQYYDSDSPSEKPFREKAPILEIKDESLFNRLDVFGYKLYLPVMNRWFKNNFNKPVKSITTYF
jgi:hypothetical protein